MKAVIFLSSAIMKMKLSCFRNQLFEPMYFPIFGPRCLHFTIKVKQFEGFMVSVANRRQRRRPHFEVLISGIYLTSMVNILPCRKTLISPHQHLRFIANNLNSTNTTNQLLASIALTKIKEKVVSPVECRRQTSDGKLYRRHAARQPLKSRKSFLNHTTVLHILPPKNDMLWRETLEQDSRSHDMRIPLSFSPAHNATWAK